MKRSSVCRSEQWDEDLVVLFEEHRHRKTASEVGRVAFDDVGGNSKVGLLDKLDDRDHVGWQNVGMELLLVYREREDRASAADRFSVELAIADRAPAYRGMDPAGA